jgi:ATP-dependent Clp protease ATP-binding subunit ClpA
MSKIIDGNYCCLYCTIDRQFPDKAIDLIDEACAATRMLVDSEIEATATRTQICNKQKVNAQSRAINAVKEGIVGPAHVAQVGIPSLKNIHYSSVLCACHVSTLCAV